MRSQALLMLRFCYAGEGVPSHSADIVALSFSLSFAKGVLCSQHGKAGILPNRVPFCPNRKRRACRCICDTLVLRSLL